MSEQFSYRVRGFFGRLPCEPHQLTDAMTPTERCIVLCHLGVLDIVSGDDWELEIGGLIGTPATFSVRQLKAFAKTEVVSVHQCAGSPLAPTLPTQRVCNVTWSGVRLSDLLEQLEIGPDANFIWSYGADSGAFGGMECGPYVKDLPLPRIADDVLLAYEMNGAALLPEHGFPLRLVVPGFYGTNSVKWLRRLELRAERAASPFTTNWYNDPQPDGTTRPVWEIAPQSVIVSPRPGLEVKQGDRVNVWGWAWADGGVAAVDVSCDGERTWLSCRTEAMTSRGWIRFSCEWTVAKGCNSLTSLATSRAGDRQPQTGRRNALFHVPIVVF
jgi:DMSO/TMAO reductase YedYZ molybdopterin-dependent catalytic subunit